MDKQADYSRWRLIWNYLHNLPGPQLEPSPQDLLDFAPRLGTGPADKAAIGENL